jgi:hypothetical protein
MAATVRFAFGSEPVISGLDALELAGLLERLCVTAAFSVASKIRFEALRLTVGRSQRQTLALDKAELKVLLVLLNDAPATRIRDALRPLHQELRAVLHVG